MSEIKYTILAKQYCKAVAELLVICFPDMHSRDQYNETELEEMADIFPEGTFVALDGERVVGVGIGVFLDIDFDNMPPTEDAMLQLNWQVSIEKSGAYYYGTDMAVHPEYRGRGIAREIYNHRKRVTVEHNRKGFAAAAVLPGYREHKHHMSINVYLAKVVTGELFDPTLTVQLRNDFRVIRPLADFFIFPQSDNWSALIVWDNPEYKES